MNKTSNLLRIIWLADDSHAISSLSVSKKNNNKKEIEQFMLQLCLMLSEPGYTMPLQTV